MVAELVRVQTSCAEGQEFESQPSQANCKIRRILAQCLTKIVTIIEFGVLSSWFELFFKIQYLGI